MSFRQKCPPTVEWKDACNGSGSENGFLGGRDLNDTIYVGRASHAGDLLPGKIVPSHGCCYVSYAGEEHRKTTYQVMCDTHSSVGGWMDANGGNVPLKAIQGGVTVDGEALYIGRVRHEGTLTVGKRAIGLESEELGMVVYQSSGLWALANLNIHPSHRCCYIPFGGREHSYSSYEVLVRKGS